VRFGVSGKELCEREFGISEMNQAKRLVLAVTGARKGFE